MGDLELGCYNLNYVLNDVIDEEATLIINKMGRATKPSNDVFIQKFSNVFCLLFIKVFASTHFVVWSVATTMY
jgi:hypothetical protein